jgi:protein SCO1/2
VSKKYGINLNTVFITIDPDRDTPEVLQSYLKIFDPKIIGLTGSSEEIAQVAQIFNAYYAKAINENDPKNYMLNHSSFVYIVDSHGKIVKLFGFTDDAKDIIEFIRIHFRKQA